MLKPDLVPSKEYRIDKFPPMISPSAVSPFLLLGWIDQFIAGKCPAKFFAKRFFPSALALGNVRGMMA